MAAPLALVPQTGRILSRPRREGLYDTENFLAASTTVTDYRFFESTRQFTDDSAGNKVAELDTNLVGSGGAVTKGHYLRVFGVNLYLTRRGTALLTGAGIDDKRKIVDASWWQLKLGSTPYLTVPTHRIPAGAGICGPISTTENAVTVGDVQQGCTAGAFYDLTTPGKRKVKKRVRTPQGAVERTTEKFDPRIPLEFGEVENFTIHLKFNTRPTITTASTVSMIMYLNSIFLKPLSS